MEGVGSGRLKLNKKVWYIYFFKAGGGSKKKISVSVLNVTRCKRGLAGQIHRKQFRKKVRASARCSPTFTWQVT